MSLEDTLAERGSRYGDFTDHARCCQSITESMRLFSVGTGDEFKIPWDDLPDTHKQALTVIADKIARILSGDPNYADNWHDIQGYAKLVEDRLPKEPKPFQHPLQNVASSSNHGALYCNSCKSYNCVHMQASSLAEVCPHGIPANEGCRTCAGEY
jgi:hypothetical protein